MEDEGASSELPGHQQPAQEQKHNDPAGGHSEAVPGYRVIIIISGLLLDNNHITLILINIQRITYQMLVDSVMPQPRSMMSLMPCTVSVCGSSLT